MSRPGQKPDYSKDTRIPFGLHGISDPSPADGSIWGSSLARPGYIVRIAPGSNPPDTALAEVYKVPLPGTASAAWTSIATASFGCRWVLDTSEFDRRKCKGPLNEPGAERARNVRRGGRSIRCPASPTRRSRRRGEPLLSLG